MAVLEVAGVERFAAVEESGGIVIDHTLNRRSTATFSLGMSVAVAKLDEVIAYRSDGTTPTFGGIVLARQVAGDPEGSAAAITRVDCADFAALFEFCYSSLSYDTPVSLETFIDDLVTECLGAYGLTYTPTATGVLLAAFSFRVPKKVADAVQEIRDRTGIVVAVSPAKVITLVTMSGSPAPFDITAANAHLNALEVSWKDASPNPTPNHVTVIFGGSGEEEAVETFVVGTDGVVNGDYIDYITDYPATVQLLRTWPAVVLLDGVPLGPMAYDAADGLFAWNWQPTHHRVRYDTNFDGTIFEPTPGAVLTVAYTKQYPATVTAATGATPVIQHVEVRDDVREIARAQEIADGVLDKISASPRAVTVTTLVGEGVEPGQEMDIDLPIRQLTGTFSVTGVRETIFHTHRIHEIELIEGDIFRDYVDDLQAVLGSGGSAGGSSPLAVAPSGSGPVVTGQVFAPLGGRRTTSIAADPAAWMPVPDHVDFVPTVSFSALVRAVIWARDAGVTVTARLRNVTDSTDVESAPVTSQTPTAVTIAVSLVAGKEYRLEILNSANGAGVYGIGTLQSL